MSGDKATEDTLKDLSDEERAQIRAYLMFSNGDGLKVFEDLMFTFNDFGSETFNEELQEIPHPYREYVKAGCRMVMQKIKDINKIAEEIR